MATKHVRAASRTRDDWAKLVRAWKGSGLTAAEFAGKHGLRPKALSTWQWRLRTAPKKAPGVAMPKLVQLAVADLVGPGDTDAARWELTTIDGHKLRALAPISNSELKFLLAALVQGRGRT